MNNKMDRKKDLQKKSKDPTVRRADSMLRNKRKPRSRWYHRPCCPRTFDQANPTPATQPFVTCRCEFVRRLPAPGPCVKDSGKGLDAQKFGFGALNNW